MRITLDPDVPVPMRDGTILYADIYRPANVAPVPVLVKRTPYDKSLPLIRMLSLDPLLAATRGYAVMIQDTRGRYRSEGEFYPFRDEASDGYDTVEWAASQPWSSGRVGMYGGSYNGATQWLTAVASPPSLVTMFPTFTPSDYHDGWVYQGGAFSLGFSLYWALYSFTVDTLVRKVAESEGLQRGLAALIKSMDGIRESYCHLPLKECPSLAGLAPYYFDWIAHPNDDGYWRRWNIGEHHASISLPVCHVGGWYDLFLGGTLANYAGMRRSGGSPEARQHQRLVIGPWAHGATPANVTGEMDFGVAASPDALGLADIQLRWFDHWLKGEENGVLEEPPVRIFIMGENAWRDEYEWPLARTQYTSYYFHSNGRANSLSGDGLLTTVPPGTEPPDIYLYDPRDPVPTHGGGCMLPGSALHHLHGPKDQRIIEARRDVLVYTTPPLEEAVEVTGPVIVKLFASSSAVDTDFTAKLVDVHPDGYAQNLTDGIIRARYRESQTHPTLLEPGRTYEYVIDLWATSNLFKEGHCIRLEISSSNFPRFDRNSNTGHAFGQDTELLPAIQTIYHDIAHPSHIVLPIVAR